MLQLVMIGIGGFIGAVLRYLTSDLVQRLSGSGFPYGTLAVNVLGCLVIGFLAVLAEERGIFTPEARALVFVGVLGAFTTFSNFSYETSSLLRSGQSFPALLNIGVQIGLGLVGVWSGMQIALRFFRL
jgi:CrcB protein